VRGQVRISASPAFGRSRLVPVIATLSERYPELRLDVVLSGQRLDFIEAGIDLAIREGRLEDSSLIARPLGGARIVLAASAAYLARCGRPRRVADLARHDLLLVPRAEAASRILDAFDSDAGPALERARIRVNDLFALAELAVAGAGIAALPDYVLEAPGLSGRLELVLPRASLGELQLHAVYPARRHLPRRVQVVLEALFAASRT